MSERESAPLILFLDPTRGAESLQWNMADNEPDPWSYRDIETMPSDAFAALCIAIRRAANEREKTQGYKVKLEES